MLAEAVAIDIGWILATLTGAGGVIGIMFKLLISAKEEKFALIMKEKDSLIAELESMKKLYQGLAAEAVKSAADTTNFYRGKYENKAPILLPAAVIPEGNSPPSAKQLETAHAATMRAAMAMIKIETGQEPRIEPGHGE